MVFEKDLLESYQMALDRHHISAVIKDKSQLRVILEMDLKFYKFNFYKTYFRYFSLEFFDFFLLFCINPYP